MSREKAIRVDGRHNVGYEVANNVEHERGDGNERPDGGIGGTVADVKYFTFQ